MATTATFLTPTVHPQLRPFVASVHAYELRGFAPGTHVGLPSTALTFIVAFEDGIDMARMPRPDRTPERFDALVGGLHDGPVHIRHDGTQVGIQLGLTPAGARALLGHPAGALAGEVVSLEAVLGTDGTRLREQVGEAMGLSGRLGVLTDLLRRRLGDHPTARPDVTAAWSMLADARRPRPVAEVARQLGWSRRHLGELVREEYGLAPKAIAQTARFDRARLLMTGRPDLTIAMVAATCGFADQAHLTRDWHRFVGTSPTAWMREEVLPFVQDDRAFDGAPSSA